MTQDNIVKLTSTSNHGYRYSVYSKDNPKKVLYMGEISEDPNYCSCTCTGFSLLSKCYHNKRAKQTMEIKI